MADAALAARRFLQPDFMRRAARLDLAVRLAVESYLAGQHRSVRRGFSVEFSDYREYSPGDDAAEIDWRVYARTDKYYLKCFEAETSTRCTLAVDCSRSMAWRSRPELPTKGEYAGFLAAALGYLLFRQRDRVGLALFDARLRALIPPKSRRAHLYSVLEALGRGIDNPSAGEAGAALHELAAGLRRKGMTVVLSDLLTSRSEEAIAAVEHLAWRGQDVLVLQVLDPAELDPRLGAGELLREPETGREYELDGFAATRCRDAVRTLLAGYRARFRDMGIDYAVLSTEEPFDRALGAFLTARARRRRGGTAISRARSKRA
jgi:uncharacterized protein (DUF58 family)